MKLIITRHGETEWNLLRKTQGATDTMLTDRGRSQALTLAKRLTGQPIHAIYASTLTRARDTAGIISEKVHAPVYEDGALCEYSFGEWEGENFDTLKDKFPDVFSVWSSNPMESLIPGADNFREYSDRIKGFLKRVYEGHPNDNVMIVSHALTSKLLIVNALRWPIEHIHNIRIDNASLNILKFDDSRVVVELINDTNHLHELSL